MDRTVMIGMCSRIPRRLRQHVARTQTHYCYYSIAQCTCSYIVDSRIVRVLVFFFIGFVVVTFHHTDDYDLVERGDDRQNQKKKKTAEFIIIIIVIYHRLSAWAVCVCATCDVTIVRQRFVECIASARHTSPNTAMPRVCTM